jgi:integrase/recombinase XerC
MPNHLTQKYLDHLQFQRRYSEHTLSAYRSDLNQFYDYLEHVCGVSDWTMVHRDMLRSWISELMESNMQARTVNRKLSAVKSFMAFLYKQELIESNPVKTVRNVKIPKRLPKALALKEANALMDGLRLDGNYSEILDAIILSVLYHTGIRRSELIGLRKQNVNLVKKQILVMGKGRKERLIPLGSEVIEHLKVYEDAKGVLGLSGESYFLTKTGNQLYPKFVYNSIRAQLMHATTAGQKSPHVLRHSFATHLLQNGADLNAIKELLGHKSLNATQIYANNSIEHLKLVYKKHPKA